MKYILVLILASTSVAFAGPEPQRSHLQPNATVYIVPSDAAARFAHIIRHPPRLSRGFYAVPLQLVDSAEQAKYTASCVVVGGATHHRAFSILASGYLPLDVQLEVRASKTGELLATRKNDILGGGSPKKMKLTHEAQYCAHHGGSWFPD